ERVAPPRRPGRGARHGSVPRGLAGEGAHRRAALPRDDPSYARPGRSRELQRVAGAPRAREAPPWRDPARDGGADRGGAAARAPLTARGEARTALRTPADDALLLLRGVRRAGRLGRKRRGGARSAADHLVGPRAM